MTAAASSPPATERFLVWYTCSVTALGGVVIAHAVYQLPSTPQPLGWIALSVVALVATRFALKLPGVAAHISTCDTFFFVSSLLYGPGPATINIALDSLVMSWNRNCRWQQLLFNMSSSAASLWAGAYVYLKLAEATGDAAALDGAGMLIPLAAMTVVYFLLNSGLTCVAIGASTGTAPMRLWRHHFAFMSVNYFAAASAAFSLIVVVRHAGIVAAVAVLPLILVLYITMRSFLGRLDDARHHIERINALYLSTVGAFATAIEAKDGVTSNHIYRVRTYALELAAALGITDESALQALEAAALLHDTGKIAIPDHILNKPGRLTPHEYDTMKLHVDAGVHILSSIDFPYAVVPIVRGHHENWDGSGYPDGLQGNAIPLGARILSVVDCYDALTSKRPYRPAMETHEALALVQDRRGTMYDPEIVDAFVRIRRQRVCTEVPLPEAQQALRRIRDSGAASFEVGAQLAAPEARAVIPASQDLLGFVSLAHLARHRGTKVDVARVAWGLTHLILPSANLAFFEVDKTTDRLTVIFAGGSAALWIRGVSIGRGDCVSGWVAANQRSIINAQAELELPAGTLPELTHAAAFPLLMGSDLLGVITIYTAGPITTADAERLELITPHLSNAIRVADAQVINTGCRSSRVKRQGKLTPLRH